MSTDVDSILSEIKERVLAEERARETAVASPQTPAGNGSLGPVSAKTAEELARMSAHLTTTARAWDRLPPLVSNRSGTMARLELWIKARLKTLTRWFTWEQVNFNAAVHHAFIESFNALSGLQDQLAEIRNELRKRNELDEQQMQKLRSTVEDQQAQLRKLSSDLEQQKATAESDLSGLAAELRAALERLQAEQVVCFKQLSLEASETAVLEDRGRRAIETRLARLEAALAKKSK